MPLRMQTNRLEPRGLLCAADDDLHIGTYVNATLWLAELAVHVRGRIVTRHPQFGNGIMFLEFKDKGVQLLARYLDTIAERIRIEGLRSWRHLIISVLHSTFYST